MEIINVMQRIEMKYVLNKAQLEYLKEALKEHMKVDQFGQTSIASIYYDTPDYRLIRTSIEKPVFKEKIRLRAYGLVKENDNVFLEVKRKADGLVYKRRKIVTEEMANKFFNDECDKKCEDQIGKEIMYFKNYYKKLMPAFMVIYDRTAYEEINGDLRLTIDENARYRTDHLDLHTSMDGTPLLDEGSAILEIKVQEVMPLWLVSILSKGQIYQTSFSKVGEAYKKEILSNLERKQNVWAHCSQSYQVLTKSLSH